MGREVQAQICKRSPEPIEIEPIEIEPIEIEPVEIEPVEIEPLQPNFAAADEFSTRRN
jgi:hypothetical protein